MQAIFETVFDILYLGTVITLGILMIAKARSGEQRLFGVMAVVLGGGDAFHLIPRAYALCTDGLAAHPASLGFGKFVTSITMTVFYVMLYHVWQKRYHKQQKNLTAAVYLLAALRILLCLMPQNRWLSPDAPLSWGIARNIPFAALGVIVVIAFYREAFRTKDKPFRFMWLAVTLSFLFYIPVVLFSSSYPMIGMLMIPKTLAYVWIVWMGFQIRKPADQ